MLTLVDGVAAQAWATPEAVAVVCGTRRLSYRELDAEVDRLAGALRRRGVAPGDLVAVFVPRSVEMLVAVLAVGRAGAAYLPLDPAYPARRRATVLADAAPKLVLTTATGRGELAGPVATLEELADEAGPVDLAAPGPADLAYVIYTSGSTGRPKGVAVPHRALTAFLRAMRRLLAAGPDGVWLNLTTLSFDISTLELFLPLLTGGRTVIVPEGLVRDGPGLARLIREDGVTHVQATPSGWRILLDGGFGPAPVVALAGGEALPLPLARELRGRVARLFNVYGPTEVTVWATCAELPEPVTEVTIGRPLPNTHAYVLDAALTPVPEGELYLGGAQVAAGYLGRPELTEQRFVPDPFHGGRMYRTGDLCRVRPDGELVFLGRLDDQVKLRGHRIELGEVEAALLGCEGVRQAAVALRGQEQPRLVGYLVGDGPADPGRLQAELAAVLPAVMVPTAWVTLDRLPLTPNGKLDRSALPDPPAEWALPAAPSPTEDPTTEQVRDIWQEALRLSRVELGDDLFDLGGDSLTAARIAARVHQRLGVELPLETIYEEPTLGAVAAAVTRLVGTRPPVAATAGGRA